jgi:hypothetical protein
MRQALLTALVSALILQSISAGEWHCVEYFAYCSSTNAAAAPEQCASIACPNNATTLLMYKQPPEHGLHVRVLWLLQRPHLQTKAAAAVVAAAAAATVKTSAYVPKS